MEEEKEHLLQLESDSDNGESEMMMMDDIQIEPEQSSQMMPGLLEEIRKKQLIEEAVALGLQVGEADAGSTNRRELK